MKLRQHQQFVLKVQDNREWPTLYFSTTNEFLYYDLRGPAECYIKILRFTKVTKNIHLVSWYNYIYKYRVLRGGIYKSVLCILHYSSDLISY